MILHMKLLVATNNKGKMREFNKILGELGIECVSLQDMNIEIDVEENGKTFLENAKIKAKEIYKIAKMPTVSDDSGLEVDALNGEPGVYSARYSGVHGEDEKNNELVLEKLKDVTDEKRTARFKSAVYLVLDDEHEYYAEGSTEGLIMRERKGENGFGYDPIFFSTVLNKGFAEATSKEKNSVSHRGRAIRALKEQLEKLKEV